MGWAVWTSVLMVVMSSLYDGPSALPSEAAPHVGVSTSPSFRVVLATREQSECRSAQGGVWSEDPFEVVDRGAEVGGQRRVGPRHIRIVATSHCPAGRIEARGLAPCGEVGLPSTSEHAAETWAG